ncbi:MAG: hypothetical protein PHX20_02550, partial [Candidatus Omnitrophica bacterium]|nr:hypothetical protein [Candidatus Omnitrophota bacterium]
QDFVPGHTSLTIIEFVPPSVSHGRDPAPSKTEGGTKGRAVAVLLNDTTHLKYGSYNIRSRRSAKRKE